MVPSRLLVVALILLAGCPRSDPSPEPPFPPKPAVVWPSERLPAPAPASPAPPVESIDEAPTSEPAAPVEVPPVEAPPVEPPAPPPVVDPRPEPSETEMRERYVSRRALELARGSLAGTGASPDVVEQQAEYRREQAGLEWEGLQVLLEVGRELQAEQPERAADFRAAFNVVWPIERDVCGSGERPDPERMRALMLRAAGR